MPLWGREGDLDRLSRALAPGRHVAVVGPPGVGKTRLATEAAAQSGRAVIFADLRAAHDRLAIVTAVAERAEIPLGAIEDAARGIERLARVIEGRGDVLVVLDNAEHVVEDVRVVAEALSERAPSAVVLCASRHWPAADWPIVELRGLDTSSADAPAVEMFRALSQLDAADAVDREQIRAIVRALDGNPLAIRISAMRARTLGLPAVDRDLVGATLVALDDAIEHSWKLLTGEEQHALLRLSVFPDAFQMRVGMAMIGDRGVELLDGLVRKSLIEVTSVGARSSQRAFRLFVSVREHVLRRLAPGGELEAMRAAHDELVLTFTEREAARTGGLFAREVRGDALGTHASIRDVLERRLGGADDGRMALRAAIALAPHYAFGALRELAEHARRALVSAGDGAPATLRIGAMVVRGHALGRSGLGQLALEELDRAMELAQRSDDADARAWIWIARLELFVFMPPASAAAVIDETERAVSGARDRAAATAYFELAKAAHFIESGSSAEALRSADRARAIFDERGVERFVAIVDLYRVGCLVELGRCDEALVVADRAIEQLERIREVHLTAWAHLSRARLHLRTGALAKAEPEIGVALSAARTSNDRRCEGYALAAQAMLEVSSQHPHAATTAARALETLRATGDVVSLRCAVSTLLASQQDSAARKPLMDELAAMGDTAEVAALVALHRADEAGVVADEPWIRELITSGSIDVAWLARVVAGRAAGARRSRPSLLVARSDGSSFAVGGVHVDLARRVVLRRMLAALLRRWREERGKAVSTWDLFELAWPGEQASPESASNRVYVTIGRLRKLGLQAHIVTLGDGFALDPHCDVQLEDEAGR